jgi:serine/threonine protein kinase
LDFLEDHKNFYIVLEYIDGKDLVDYLNSKEKTCSIEGNKKFMNQLASGLRYLHNLGIAHRDIKLENIMIASNNENDTDLKIIDFGLSTVVYSGETMKATLGTLIYCAPEVLKGTNYNLKSDIWSLGVVFYILLFGKIPFYRET